MPEHLVHGQVQCHWHHPLACLQHLAQLHSVEGLYNRAPLPQAEVRLVAVVAVPHSLTAELAQAAHPHPHEEAVAAAQLHASHVVEAAEALSPVSAPTYAEAGLGRRWPLVEGQAEARVPSRWVLAEPTHHTVEVVEVRGALSLVHFVALGSFACTEDLPRPRTATELMRTGRASPSHWLDLPHPCARPLLHTAAQHLCGRPSGPCLWHR